MCLVGDSLVDAGETLLLPESIGVQYNASSVCSIPARICSLIFKPALVTIFLYRMCLYSDRTLVNLRFVHQHRAMLAFLLPRKAMLLVFLPL